ncbi:MAG: serine/threonine protein phosphatase [Rhodobacterales bacterium]|nr:MAG: serine/threonine protein phosphatase [Rhodobacterales bacterium]
MTRPGHPSGPIYAMGDLHGQRAMLDQALERINRDGGANAPLVVLGDLVDRGPDSCGVIQTLMDGAEAGKPWITLRGNHDRLFMDYLDTGALDHPLIRSKRSWDDPVMGGRETLASYGVDPDLPEPDRLEAARAAVPQSHRAFLAACPLYHVADGVLFVHAGIQPRLPLEWQSEDDLIWIREPFLDHRAAFDWLVVHGHTWRETPEHCGNRVNLDSGAGWGHPLTTAVIENGQVWTLTETGRVALKP